MITYCERCVARRALGDRPTPAAAVPEDRPPSRRPKSRVDHRAVRSGLGLFGITRATAHRWLQTWTDMGLWPTIHRAVLDELGRRALLDWSRATVDSQSLRAKRRGEHGDKTYHSRDRRHWLRERQIGVRIARPGVESSQRLGRHRYKVERSIAWLDSYRRLTLRWERKASTFLTMLGIACILICYKHLAKHVDGF